MNIHTADISPGGEYFAGITAEGSVLVWNPEDIHEYRQIQSERKNITTVRFKEDGRILAMGNTEGFVELWDVSGGERISGIRAHEGRINDIRFNGRLNQMATAGNDSCIRIFDISDVAGLSVLPVVFADNGGTVSAIAFSNDGQQIVSGVHGNNMNLASRPVSTGLMAQDICSLVTRNLTEDEWSTWVGRDIPAEKACRDVDFRIRIREVR
ncbi:MAG: hypothetical protein GX876_08335 [Bacteroidales bacterium]|nr:hypothetical protein [Bacteroidales bacterium]